MKCIFDKSIPVIGELLSHHPFELNPKGLITANDCKDADILICRSTLSINEALLKASNVKLVATCTSGTNHIDSNYLNNSGIELIDARGCNAKSVCDYVFASLASLHDTLEDKSIGIIGVGHVGSKVSKFARALGMDVKLYDPPRRESEANFKQSTLNEISQCDIITLHTPLTYSNYHPTYQLIDKKFLSSLKPNATLINTSRGEVIDEEALTACAQPLNTILDVFCHEPHISEAILKKATIATPHIAGHAIEAKQRASVIVYHKICQFLGMTPSKSNIINSESNTATLLSLDKIRKQYNPMLESEKLKKLGVSSFNVLRKAHLRHEFRLD